jgi:hypothetical protein
MTRCRICRGERQIRLPLFHPLNVESFDGGVDVQPTLEEAYRIYPCPECATPNMVAVQKLGVAKVIGKIDDRSPVPLDYIHGSLAAQMGRYLMDKGFIVWSTRPGPRYDTTTIHEGTLAVAGPEHAEQLDKVILARQREVANEVRKLAAEKIANWGSYYGTNTISKEMARLFIDEAVTEVDRRYKGEKT